MSYNWYSQPISCVFGPSRHNFRDIELKFSICSELAYSKSATKFESSGLKPMDLYKT